jgi:hypothetical protein
MSLAEKELRVELDLLASRFTGLLFALLIYP